MCDESLHAQAAVDVRRKERVNPARIFGAAFMAVVSAPQGDYGEEPGFLIGNQYEASGKTSDFLQCACERGRNGRLRATCFFGLGNKLNAQRRH